MNDGLQVVENRNLIEGAAEANGYLIEEFNVFRNTNSAECSLTNSGGNGNECS